MSWKDKMQEFGGCDVSFLTVDGEVITFVVCTEPELIQGKYKGKDTKRIGFIIASQDGVSVFVVGMRVARRLAKHEALFNKRAFEVIRHGEPNDADATYEVKVLDDEGVAKELFAIKQKEFNAKDVSEMMSEVAVMIKS